MDCVILVGGEGTRLRPLTYNTPKQMLKVAGVTMIDRVLYYLSKNSVTRAVLSLGYKPDKFLKAYPDSKAYGIELMYAVEPEPLDTAGAIRFAAKYAGFDSRFVVVNGDVMTDLSVLDLIGFHEKSDAVGTIALTPVLDPSRFGVVPTDDSGKVIAFIEKPDAATAPTNYINAGTYVLENEVLDLIDSDRRVSIEREIFPLLVEKSCLFGMPTDSYWLDLGTPQSLIKASCDILTLNYNDELFSSIYSQCGDGNWIRNSVQIPEAASESLFESGLVFNGNSKINLTTFGIDCVIGNGAVVSESIIGDGCKIGANVTIRNSIIGDNVEFKDNVTLIDCIIGDEAQLQEGEKMEQQRYPT